MAEYSPKPLSSTSVAGLPPSEDTGSAAARAALLRSSLIPSRPFIPLCPSLLRSLCSRSSECEEVHFEKALQPHTEERLGDCSYLNTCHRQTQGCRYVHWRLEDPGPSSSAPSKQKLVQEAQEEQQPSLPPQWINADLRSLDVTALGKFEVVVADPPWAIHQELPYGTLTDSEMLHMPIGAIQDPGGLLFLWVTGRAMELGRDCLRSWGYERIDELVWVKTNQLGGLIRTGRTGHWLNHSKEHCLVAVRLPPSSTSLSSAAPVPPSWFNTSLDTQVILAEVRETSRKPDELYDMIERILRAPDKPKGRGRKVELFGRTHNLRPGWLTIGNQFGSGNGDQVFEREVVERFAARYPERGMRLMSPATMRPVD